MTTNTDAVPECYPLGIIQEAIASRIPREFSGWREWPGTRVLAQAVVEALKVREILTAAQAAPVPQDDGDEQEAFEWPPLPALPDQGFYAHDRALFTEHQMQGYANAYGEAVRAALASKAAPIAVASGWKLVPIEPTDRMTFIGQKHRHDTVWSIGAIYREMLGAAPAAPHLEAAAVAVTEPKLTVWYGSMPESNGKTNWTAILHKGDVTRGITLDMSEYPERVRYGADRVRWLIGELDKEPWILDYDADKHGVYVAPTPIAAQEDLLERALAELVNKIDTGLDSGDLLQDARRASTVIDSILKGGDLVACAHNFFRESPDRYENSIEFRIGWDACLDAIGEARKATPHAPIASPSEAADDDARNLVTLDRRDLWDCMRGAIHAALNDKIPKNCVVSWAWEEATNRTMDIFQKIVNTHPAAAQPAQTAQSSETLTAQDVERQYRDGIHIGSGLPRATCPCGFCMKHRFGFNRGDDAPQSAPTAVVLDDERATDCDARIRKWRDSFDAMHARAMRAEEKSATVDDLAMLVKKLVRHVRKASPDNNMAEMALDYLRRHGLEGSPLRTVAQRVEQTQALTDAQLDEIYLVAQDSRPLSEFREEVRALLSAAQQASDPAAQPSRATFDMLAHLQRQREWSEHTFGPGSRAKGVVDHIRKELVEIEADPTDLTEWIDVVILALDGAWRSGAQPQQIIDTIVAKQTKNEGRVWPDWRTMPVDKAIEHDRAHDQQVKK